MTLQQGSLKLIAGTQTVEADGWLRLFQSAIAALKAIDKHLSTHGVESLRWRIIDIGANSPIYTTIQGTLDRNGDQGYSQQVVDLLACGVEHLLSDRSCPRDFNRHILKHVKTMAHIGVRYALRPKIATEGREILVKKSVARNADWAIKRLSLRKSTYTEYGSLEGVLQELSVSHGRDRLVIVEKLTGEKTPCYLRNPSLDAELRKAWKKRVVVTGEIVVKRETKKPVKIKVDEIRILRERSELPQIEDLRGIDITGGVESSEYIRTLRDDE
jgi:hypothetical protein